MSTIKFLNSFKEVRAAIGFKEHFIECFDNEFTKSSIPQNKKGDAARTFATDSAFAEALMVYCGISYYGISVNGELASTAELTLKLDGTFTVTIFTNKKYRRQGYAQKLLQALLDEYGEKLIFHVQNNNIPSAKLMAKLNLKPISSIVTQTIVWSK